MVIEFSRQEDIKQACYEATVDLSTFVIHLHNIAKRCEKNFPEIAAGLRGSADGIMHYLEGIEGTVPRTRSIEELRTTLNQPDFLNHLWAYDFCRDPRGALLIFGCMCAYAAAKPSMTFWEALAEARGKMETFEAVIEKLLASSPRRTQ
jgi:hypothetical protein